MIRKTDDMAIAAPVILGIFIIFVVAWFVLRIALPMDNQLITTYVSMSNFVNITPEHHASSEVGRWVIEYAMLWLAVIAVIIALVKDWHKEKSGMG